MIFLIEYNRSKGMITKLQKFSDSQRQEAEESRLNLELSLIHEKVKNEVVLLQARDEESLRLTHGRYFKNATDIIMSRDIVKSCV